MKSTVNLYRFGIRNIHSKTIGSTPPLSRIFRRFVQFFNRPSDYSVKR